jgi:hypothetical protein
MLLVQKTKKKELILTGGENGRGTFLQVCANR